ncbi:MAG: 30S ribosomal protein S6e [Candidatus Methanomethyliaceae archaeon]|nr:30S ribosomal protein S6e [Candidatus Methanomethyliaceae archaeon]MDW7970386.1 30S ribosomal protein S6e [Nitrososphaerota archaeon]
MVEFKLVISNPEDGTSKALNVKDEMAQIFIGLKIGDHVDGEVFGHPGKKLVITGGSDKSGIPMRPDIPGGAKKYILLSGPPGYHPKRKGERRRKLVRGNMITEDIVQINLVLKEEKNG